MSVVDSSIRWGRITVRGPQHAFREHWRGGDLFASECSPRSFYPARTLHDLAPRPSDKVRLCQHLCCQHALRLLPPSNNQGETDG